MITADPMTRLDRTHLSIPPPRPVPTGQIQAVLQVIPKTKDRDRLLFGLLSTPLVAARAWARDRRMWCRSSAMLARCEK